MYAEYVSLADLAKRIDVYELMLIEDADGVESDI